jgi:hypothetical protein
MSLRHAHIESGVARVAVLAVGVGSFPVVMAEMRLGQGDEHPRVVRGPQDLLKAQVRARLAAVVVRVDEVDAEALETLQALAGRAVGGPRGADVGVIQRDGRQEDAGPVELEVAAFDPELAEPEGPVLGGIQHPAPRVEQREAQGEPVARRMEIPEPIGLPGFGDRDASVLEFASREGPAREFDDV